MASLDFSRSVEKDLETKEDRLFDAVLDFTRDDEAAVDFTSKTIKLEIYDRDGGTLVDTLTSGAEITIATAKLKFSKIFTALLIKSYYYELFNDTDKIGISHGLFIVK